LPPDPPVPDVPLPEPTDLERRRAESTPGVVTLVKPFFSSQLSILRVVKNETPRQELGALKLMRLYMSQASMHDARELTFVVDTVWSVTYLSHPIS
jgi:hypothetical protein